MYKKKMQNLRMIHIPLVTDFLVVPSKSLCATFLYGIFSLCLSMFFFLANMSRHELCRTQLLWNVITQYVNNMYATHSSSKVVTRRERISSGTVPVSILSFKSLDINEKKKYRSVYLRTITHKAVYFKVFNTGL